VQANIATRHTVIAPRSWRNLACPSRGAAAASRCQQSVLVADKRPPSRPPDTNPRRRRSGAKGPAGAVDARIRGARGHGRWPKTVLCRRSGTPLVRLSLRLRKSAATRHNYAAPYSDTGFRLRGRFLAEPIAGSSAAIPGYWAHVEGSKARRHKGCGADRDPLDYSTSWQRSLSLRFGLPSMWLGNLTCAHRHRRADHTGGLGRRKVVYAVPRHISASNTARPLRRIRLRRIASGRAVRPRSRAEQSSS